MAGLAAGPVDKDVLLDALSNKEGATEADATQAHFPGPYEEDEDQAGYVCSEEEAAEREGRDSFNAFLDAPDSGDDEDDQEAMRSILNATGHFEDFPQGMSSMEIDPLRDLRQPGGVVASYRDTAQLNESLGEQRVAKAADALRRDFSLKDKATLDAKSALADEEAKLRALMKQAEAGKLQDHARLSYQEREVSKAWERLTQCEKARDAAELALHRAQDSGDRAGANVAQEADHHAVVAKHKRDLEIKRAKRAISQDAAARSAAKEQKKALEEEAARKAREARLHQAAGHRRLKESIAKQDDALGELDEVRENKFQHHAARVLQLKSSVDDVNRKIQSSNEAKRKKQQKVLAEREARKQQMLNEGQNPYEVWRKEEMDAEKDRQKQQLKALNEIRSEKLLGQLTTEERSYKKRQEEMKQKRVEAENFQREMGNYAKQKKVEAYIRKMTIGNVDVLDPTGTALRIDPSKVSVQKTHAFGLGRAPQSEIDKVERDLARSKKILEKRRPPRPDSADSLGSRDLGPVGGSPGGPDGDGEDAFLNDDDREELPEGKMWVPKLSKLEEQYLAAAKERQKANITSVQRCWGKEFQGDAFLAKPSIIAFDDFEVGKKYRQVIEVTNVSLTFNQFKLLPLDDKIKEFFEIQFQPPGRMSAGVTRYITLWFCPKVSQDIVSTFPILAKTGRIDFPLRCTTKKTILTVTPQDADTNPAIDFGQILSGESGSAALQIRNTGALAANFDLTPEDPNNDFVKMIDWKPSGPTFKEHGTTKIAFTFTPTVVGSFSTSLRLSITNGAVGDALHTEEKRVLVRGGCIDVPIFVEKETYDMKTCIFGHIFRETVIVHNRRSVPMKIEVDKPKQIDGELQINPTLAYIQGSKEQAIQVKFNPSTDFLEKHPQYKDASRADTPGAFRIPMTIVGAEQVLPVHTELIGTLTTNTVRFEPPEVDFGRCFVGSSVVSRLTVVNESALPQRFVFPRLPGVLAVSEVPEDVAQEEEASEAAAAAETAVLDGGGDGVFGVLLPKERRQVVLTYTPDTATETDVRVQFKAITGQLCAREFGVRCRGQGVSPVLSVSHTTVEMASIPTGTATKESVVISNLGKVPYVVNLLLPPSELCALKASPICCTLEPGQSQRLQLEFKPSEEYFRMLDIPEKPPPEEKEGEGEGEEAAPAAPAAPEAVEGEEPAEPTQSVEELVAERCQSIRQHGGRRWSGPDGRTAHATWKMPLCFKPLSKGDKPGKKDSQQLTYFAVSTCVLPTIVKVEPAIMDFGEVTAQLRKIVPLTLSTEAGVDPQNLVVEALPENQCFTVLSAPRTVTSKPFQLMVEFNPQLVQIYQTDLFLRTQSTRIQVPLRGKGVRPVLRIEPEDGVLRLGSLVYTKECKELSKKELVIRNDSPFELRYDLETVAAADPNYIGPPPFTLSPSTGVVEANGSRTVTVTFRPHRPMTLFREKILVKVPNQKEPTYVYLYGHCFRYQTYCLPGIEFGSFARAEAKRPAAFVDALALGVGAPGADPETGVFNYPKAQATEFPIVFEADGERTKFLLLGASVGQAAGAFEFQILPSDHSKYFTVEAPDVGAKPDKIAKGALKPGELPVKVYFKYNPDETSNLRYGDVELDLLGGIGQWITCKVKGVLSGGVVPQGEPATQEISVELRAYLQQI